MSHTCVKSVHLIFTTPSWISGGCRRHVITEVAIEKLDPDNMGIVVGILLLCALELEICLEYLNIEYLISNKKVNFTYL